MHFNSHPHEEDDNYYCRCSFTCFISTHILTKRMTALVLLVKCSTHYFNSHPHEEDDSLELTQPGKNPYFNSHPHEEDDGTMKEEREYAKISTHILTKRMTAILNKIFSFKIKLYIHYNILFAIFYIYNSILYPFSSQKCSYSGANDSANYCSLAFRTPRFPVPSLHIHFP